MPRLALLPTGLIALTLAACGMAGAATIQSGSPLAQAPERLDCQLILRESGGAVHVEGRLIARAATEGSYALRILHRSAGGTSQVAQGGDFVLRAGERVTLGTARFEGSAIDLVAGLTVESDGRTIDCPATARP